MFCFTWTNPSVNSGKFAKVHRNYACYDMVWGLSSLVRLVISWTSQGLFRGPYCIEYIFRMRFLLSVSRTRLMIRKSAKKWYLIRMSSADCVQSHFPNEIKLKFQTWFIYSNTVNLPVNMSVMARLKMRIWYGDRRRTRWWRVITKQNKPFPPKDSNAITPNRIWRTSGFSMRTSS